MYHFIIMAQNLSIGHNSSDINNPSDNLPIGHNLPSIANQVQNIKNDFTKISKELDELRENYNQDRMILFRQWQRKFISNMKNKNIDDPLNDNQIECNFKYYFDYLFEMDHSSCLISKDENNNQYYIDITIYNKSDFETKITKSLKNLLSTWYEVTYSELEEDSDDEYVYNYIVKKKYRE